MSYEAQAHDDRPNQSAINSRPRPVRPISVADEATVPHRPAQSVVALWLTILHWAVLRPHRYLDRCRTRMAPVA